jgi:hypothetical protein
VQALDILGCAAVDLRHSALRTNLVRPGSRRTLPEHIYTIREQTLDLKAKFLKVGLPSLMTSRRRFVLNCSTGLAAITTAPLIFAATQRKAPSSRDLNYATFAEQLNTSFRVVPQFGHTELKLVRVRLAPRPAVATAGRLPADADNEKFSLIFEGPGNFALPAAIYTFEHEQLGRFEMYFGEIGLRDSSFIRYEAVFNQRPQKV